MRQLFAFVAIVTLLGACSDPNPFGSDTASTDAARDKAAVAETKPATPKRVVIAKLETELDPEPATPVKAADPKALDRLAPASRADSPKSDTPKSASPKSASPKSDLLKSDDTKSGDTKSDTLRSDAMTDADDADTADTMPAADQAFVAYLSGKRTTTRRRAAVRHKPAAKPRKVVKIGEYQLDKIAPGAGPGRRTGNIDDAYSADRDFIKVLMTDQKPARRRYHRIRKHKRVIAKPSPRKSVTRKKTRTIRVARRTRKATRTATRTAYRRPRTQPRRTDNRALATLDGADAADREVLKVLGGK